MVRIIIWKMAISKLNAKFRKCEEANRILNYFIIPSQSVDYSLMILINPFNKILLYCFSFYLITVAGCLVGDHILSYLQFSDHHEGSTEKEGEQETAQGETNHLP